MRIENRRVRGALAGAAIGVLGLALAPSAANAAISTQAFCVNVRTGQSGFTDIAQAGVHQRNVECLKGSGITSGTTASTYTPGATVSRAAMATFIANMVDRANTFDAPGGATIPDLPTVAASADAFTDDEGVIHENNINRLAQADIVQGTTATTFTPNAPVSRAQMATFIAEALEFIRGGPLAAGSDAFTDDDTSVHQANINRLANADIVDGTGTATFNPNAAVSRAQMGSFVIQAMADLNADTFITPVPSNTNATIAVTPTDPVIVQTATEPSTTDDRLYTATGLTAGQAYRITMVDCANITNNNGQFSFSDANNDNVADSGGPAAPAASITAVNGAAPNATAPNNSRTQGGVQPVNGTITFTVDADAQGCVAPVIYVDGGASTFLDLDATDKPTEAFGVAGPVLVVPPEAPIGNQGGNVEITTVNNGADLFTGDTNAGDAPADEPGTNDLTYFYDGGDVFQFQGVGINQAQFEGAINAGDIVTVSYAPDPAGVSTFNLITDQPPTAPGAPTATVIGTNEVRIQFTPPASNSSGTTYSLLRSTVAVGPDTACGTFDDSPGAFTAVPGATVAPSGGGTFTFSDFNVANGCYRYQVRATNSVSNTTADSPSSNTVAVPRPADTAAPQALDTEQTTAGGDAAVVDSGDVIKICFNEAIADVTDNDVETLQLTDGDGTIVTVVNATTGTFARNTAPDADTAPATTPPAVPLVTSCPTDRQLSVSVTGALTPSTAGTTAGLQVASATITAAAEIEDLAGNLWDPAGDPDIALAEPATPEPS